MGDSVLEVIRDLIWSFPLLLFLLLFGGYLLVKLCKYPLFSGWLFKVTFGKLNKNGLSVFSVALGGTMGVGNIIGASSCVLLFGAGSLFWMWVSALLGMIIKYAEIVIAMVYRNYHNGEYVGGPMYCMTSSVKGFLYAVLCLITSFGIGNLVPMNTLVEMVEYRYDVSKVWFVLLMSVVIGIVLFKGKEMIEKVCLYMVPMMSVLFIGGCLVIVCLNITQLGRVFNEIFSDVFCSKSLFGLFWTQLQMGLARGIYSNEAGMGTSSIVHVKNKESVACEQGAWGILEVGVDTLISCTLSALVVLLLRDRVGLDVYQSMFVCFSSVFGVLGNYVYFISMLFFAISGMLAWCYYAEECLKYLKWSNRWYPFVFIVLLIVGSFVSTEGIWAFTDICNGLMLVLNLTSMIGFVDVIIKTTKSYFISYGYHVQ